MAEKGNLKERRKMSSPTASPGGIQRQDSYGKYASHLTNELDTLMQDTQILRQEVRALCHG